MTVRGMVLGRHLNKNGCLDEFLRANWRLLWRSGVHRIQAECRTERIGGGFVSLLLVDRVMSLWLKDGV